MALRGRLLAGRQNLHIGRDVAFVGPPNRIRFGRDVTLYGRCYLNANGPAGGISIGAHSHIDQNSVLYGQGGLTIGRDCAIAAGVIIYSQTNADSLGLETPVSLQPTRYDPVDIADGCWLGAGVRVVPGVRIGAGAHVGAGAVVISDIEPFGIAVGVPARTVKRRKSGRSGEPKGGQSLSKP